jgi:hypothetical protein
MYTLCRSDFEVEVRNFSGKGLCRITTRWANLGNGKTPFEIKWQRQVWLGADGAADPAPARAGDPGGVRAAFETEEGQSLRILRTENIAKLFPLPKNLQIVDLDERYCWRRMGEETLIAGAAKEIWGVANDIFPLLIHSLRWCLSCWAVACCWLLTGII